MVRVLVVVPSPGSSPDWSTHVVVAFAGSPDTLMVTGSGGHKHHPPEATIYGHQNRSP